MFTNALISQIMNPAAAAGAGLQTAGLLGNSLLGGANPLAANFGGLLGGGQGGLAGILGANLAGGAQAAGQNLPTQPNPKGEAEAKTGGTEDALLQLQALLAQYIVIQKDPEAVGLPADATQEQKLAAAQFLLGQSGDSLEGGEGSDSLVGGMLADGFGQTNPQANPIYVGLSEKSANVLSGLIEAPQQSLANLQGAQAAAQYQAQQGSGQLNNVALANLEATKNQAQQGVVKVDTAAGLTNPEVAQAVAKYQAQQGAGQMDTAALAKELTELMNKTSGSDADLAQVLNALREKAAALPEKKENGSKDVLADLRSILDEVAPDTTLGKAVTKEQQVHAAPLTQAGVKKNGENILVNKGDETTLASNNLAGGQQALANGGQSSMGDSSNFTASQQALTQTVSHTTSTTASSGSSFQHYLNQTVTDPVEQVAVKIARGLKGKNQMTIQLEPAELGKVDVKIEWANRSGMQISIVAENKAALDALQKDSRALEQALQDAGISSDGLNLQFSLREQNQQNQNQDYKEYVDTMASLMDQARITLSADQIQKVMHYSVPNKLLDITA